MMAWIGMLMLLAIFAYGVIIINDPILQIPFADGVVYPTFGWSWYLTLVTGLFCLFLGIVIVVLDYFLPRKIAIVFNRTLIEEDDVFYVEEDEEEPSKEPSGVEEYGISTRGSNRYTRRQTVSKFRQTQRKSRKTTRSTRSGLQESGDIALQDVQ